MLKSALLLCFLFLSFLCFPQDQLISAENINSEWKIFSNGKYQPYTGQATQAVHFEVPWSTQRKCALEISAVGSYTLFINNRLVIQSANKLIRLNLDSLRDTYSAHLWFTIFAKKGITVKSVTTIVRRPLIQTSENDLGKRMNDGFHDFTVTVFMMLIALFVILFRSSPKLMYDYLNAVKIFSLRERQENLLSNRVTSFSNIFYYLITSFFIAALLMVIVQRGNKITEVTEYFKFSSLLTAYLHWALMGLLIAIWLFCKLVIIRLFSILFKLRGTLQLHFFNFMRVLLLISILTSSVLFLFFITHKSFAPYQNILFVTGSVILICWLIVTFLKLLTNTSFRFFHLFSYLCATEIVPAIVLIKIIS